MQIDTYCGKLAEIKKKSHRFCIGFKPIDFEDQSTLGMILISNQYFASFERWVAALTCRKGVSLSMYTMQRHNKTFFLSH